MSTASSADQTQDEVSYVQGSVAAPTAAVIDENIATRAVVSLLFRTRCAPAGPGGKKELLTFPWVHSRPGSAGRRPPRVSMASAISAWAEWKP